MKTIEEIALEIAREAYEVGGSIEWLKGNLALQIRNALKEHRAIYIEKACKTFCKTHCKNGCILQDGFVCEKFMNFRKAMEE